MSSFERAETIAFVVTGAAILLPILIMGILALRRRVEEHRMDEQDDARIRHMNREDDEL